MGVGVRGGEGGQGDRRAGVGVGVGVGGLEDRLFTARCKRYCS